MGYIYKDVFSGDELFSDTYPMKLVDDCIYEVYGKHETRTEGEVKLEGSNASAEEADEGTDASSTSGVDIILNHRLIETGFGSKKDYLVYLKDYNRGGEVESFKKNINNYVKDMLGHFKDLQFYCGESMDNEAMIVVLDYKEYKGEERPVLLAFKHGLDEEKV